ncbi:alanine/glycine:cation symporter family protein [Sediminivirga luteola]|uniref:alanine/glycine:cation symporter family protein n=1 Tax=Sediminivirga luteola TaxID=1774748 RepID=UPI001F56C845|nr:amino acid carrier protein [Sediminivirga luteola]MCI2264954.1 alanine:cation symporter family protein [Sediminivirga luteola]
MDERVDNLFAPIADRLSAIVFFEIPLGPIGIPVVVIWLMAAAIFFTAWLKWQPIRGLKHSLDVIRGKRSAKTDPGQVSSFQALATELSGTVGLGNIAGVAVAISLGGPGAALWIVIFGFFAMTLKMAEATLGVKYRTIDKKGVVSGGPMYYLRDGLKELGWPKLGLGLAICYAVFTAIGAVGAGNLFQANQVAAAVVNATGGENSFFAGQLWILGLMMAVLTAVVVLGGITSIARWTSKVTPLMAVLYLVSTVVIILLHVTELPAAVVTIFQSAFTGEGVAGGAVGVAIIGIQRALFSNGGGLGTAGMAHAAVKTKHPGTEGYTALWEPLIDSIIICTLTALAITVTGAYQMETEDGSTAEGVAITQSAFATVADWYPYLLTACIVLFGVSTLFSYGYYGQKSIGFLFGGSKIAEKGYQIFWVLAVIVGASVSLDSVIAFSDAVFFLMVLPNLLGMYFLARVLRLEILRHQTRTEVGTLGEIPDDLQVGMTGRHDPTPEQVEAAKAREQRRKRKLGKVRAGFRRARAEREDETGDSEPV